jgi:IPT/TIG domain/Putative Flp pilus-assembly TadE/G-like/von Willebrand factor type A domain
LLQLRRHKRGRKPGQILVLFALVLVVILAFSALVIDIGLLRNNRNSLVNAMDAGALAGGTLLPVDGSSTGGPANAAAIAALIKQTVSATYPGLVEGPTRDYQIEYRCMIGADPATGAPLISRDIPIVCSPSNALHHSPRTSDFIGAGSTRNSACDPFAGDKCNVVQLRGAITTQFSFGRAVGVNSGSTGAVVSAACNGPCGEAPFKPLDVVIIIDRTGSMSGDERNLRDAASAVLKLYNPGIQHIALGMLGPSTLTKTCGSSPGVHAIPLDILPQPQTQPPNFQQDTSAANSSNGAGTLVINRPSNSGNNINGQLLIAGITVDGGTGTTITPPTGWTQIRRTNNGTNIGLASYYKFAGTNEPSSYTWTISPNRRAAGGIMRYTGVSTSNPIDASSGNTGNGGTRSDLRASSITTSVDDTALVAFYSSDTRTSMTDGDGMNEEFDIANGNNGGPTIMGAQDTKGNHGSTGDRDADARDAAQWAAHLIALRPVPVGPVVQEYGTNTTTDMAKWVVVGLTGTGGGAVVNESYLTGNNLNTSSGIVKAINCVTNSNLSSTGTNLATPLDMARVYLQNNGRPGVKQGIIFETDGAPNYNNTGDTSNYTCAATRSAADRAKAANIEIFTIGFGVGNENCPDGGGSAVNLLGGIATGPIINGSNCNSNGNENRDGDHFFCQPAGTDLTAVFQAAAADLAGLRTHLVQPYPAPIVTARGPSSGSHNGGTVVTITGDNFTGAVSVKFGGTNASSFTVLSDSSIRATAPGGPTGTTVDIRVTTPGGSSPITSADRFTYN